MNIEIGQYYKYLGWTKLHVYEEIRCRSLIEKVLSVKNNLIKIKCVDCNMEMHYTRELYMKYHKLVKKQNLIVL